MQKDPVGDALFLVLPLGREQAEAEKTVTGIGQGAKTTMESPGSNLPEEHTPAADALEVEPRALAQPTSEQEPKPLQIGFSQLSYSRGAWRRNEEEGE